MSTLYPAAKDTVGASGSLPVEPSGTPLSVSHIAAHQNASDAIIALETKVGVDSSADTSTIDYKLKNAGSVNPGHLHTLATGMSDVNLTSVTDGNVLVYDGASSKWKNNTTSAPDASTTVKGVSKLSVAPVSSTAPIAVGDNDTRVPTTNQTAALAGTSGTALSSSNKVVDNADTRLGAGAGQIVMFAGSVAPTGYLICDGSAVSRTTYATLFGVISTTYGSGNGSTTFNIPNLQGNVAVGYKSGDSNFGTLGNTGGEKTHVLTTTEMPSHSHGLNTNGSGGSPFSVATAGSNGSTVQNTNSAGSDGAHNNLQPYITLNYIIRF